MKLNNQKKIIAITGGIASGKSTVSEIIRKKGYPVFSCDEIYKTVCHSAEYKRALRSRFGERIFNEKGEIDRKKLAALIFSDPELRRALNDVAHPLIMEKLYEEIENTKERIVFAEVPLLFEGGYETQFDEILVVLATHSNRLEKLKKRDGLTDEEAEKRINAQFDYDTPAAKERIRNSNAKFIINDGELEQLVDIVDEYLRKI